MSCFLIQHVRNSESCGNRVKGLLGYCQLEAGVSTSFYPSSIIHSTDIFPRLLCLISSPGWNIWDWKFLQLTGDPLWRRVMDARLQSTSSAETIIKLNMCRMTSPIFYATDMTTLD